MHRQHKDVESHGHSKIRNISSAITNLSKTTISICRESRENRMTERNTCLRLWQWQVYDNPPCKTTVIKERIEETKISSFHSAFPCSPPLATTIHKNTFHPCSLLQRLELYQEVPAVAKTQQKQPASPLQPP